MSLIDTTPARDGSRAGGAVTPRRAVPVKWWAAAGAVILAFELYVLTRWVTGEHFASVPPGPSVPPRWMQVVLDAGQIISTPVAVGFIYWFLVRPWWRERRISSDGLLCIAFLLLSWQDPLSSYFGHWFTYNSALVNRGSWAYEIPGWMSFGEPGAELAQPLLVFPALYVFVFLGLSMIGAKVMRATRARIPHVGVIGQLLACWAVLALSCIIIEGFIYLPLGFYSYGGGYLPLFPETYHKLPLHEVITFGALFTPMAALRHFTNDRGEYLAERGLHKLKIGEGKRTLLRFLALAGFVQVAMFLAYNMPNLWVGAQSNQWPADVQKRSYMLGGLCGEGTGRPCPGEGVPLLQPTDIGGNRVRIGPDGEPNLIGETPRFVPFERGGAGPTGG